MCGNVRYLLTSRPIDSAICHCSDCRRSSGAQSVAWVAVPLQDFKFVKGEPAIYNSSKNIERGFCPQCGTTLSYFNKKAGKNIDITVGSIDEPEKYPPGKDFFCREKLWWVEPTTQNLEN